MKTRRVEVGGRRIVFAGCALLVGSCLIWDGASVASANSRSAISEKFTVLNEARKTVDIPPASVFQEQGHGQGGVKSDTARLIGEVQTTNFYVATDVVNNVCLIVVDDIQQFTASTCAPPDFVSQEGLALKSVYLGKSTEAFLVPDDVTVQLPAMWKRISENLVVVTGANSQDRRATAATSDGKKFELKRYDDPASTEKLPIPAKP